jgi:hypothetical protein
MSPAPIRHSTSTGTLLAVISDALVVRLIRGACWRSFKPVSEARERDGEVVIVKRANGADL